MASGVPGALTGAKSSNASAQKMSGEIKVTNIRVDVDVAKAIDVTGCHRAMALRFKQLTQSTFGPNGNNRVSPWPHLKESTRASARSKNKKTPWYVGGPATLFRTGTLFRSITASWGRDKGTVSTDNPYAAIHQFGLPMRNGRLMPWRPFFPILRNGDPSPLAQREMQKTAADFFNK